MPKYEPNTDHWDKEPEEKPARWMEETSAPTIEIDVQRHHEGYQENRKWTVHLSHRPGDHVNESDLTALYAVEHQNKGNFWRDGDLDDDAVDFVNLPRYCRQRVAAVVNRTVDEITPDERLVHREDGTGIGDREDTEAGGKDAR